MKLKSKSRKNQAIQRLEKKRALEGEKQKHRRKKRREEIHIEKAKDSRKKSIPFCQRKDTNSPNLGFVHESEEFDMLATDKSGRTFGVEAKGTKQKVTSNVVKGLKRKIDGNRLLRGGIIVSKKGYTEPALKEAKRSGIKTLKYKQKRKKKTGWFF
jgi:hypothetical protein